MAQNRLGINSNGQTGVEKRPFSFLQIKIGSNGSGSQRFQFSTVPLQNGPLPTVENQVLFWTSFYPKRSIFATCQSCPIVNFDQPSIWKTAFWKTAFCRKAANRTGTVGTEPFWTGTGPNRFAMEPLRTRTVENRTVGTVFMLENKIVVSRRLFVRLN